MTNFRSDIVALLPQLRASARALTGGDASFADDLVQDTVINALQAEQQYTPGTNLRAWLYTILRNRFCSVVRRRKFSVSVEDEELEQLSWTPAPQEGALEVQAFKTAFMQLSRTHREVLILTIIQGHPYEEVAEMCGCQVGTVKSRVNRARANLKRMLLGEDEPLEVVAESVNDRHVLEELSTGSTPSPTSLAG